MSVKVNEHLVLWKAFVCLHGVASLSRLLLH